MARSPRRNTNPKQSKRWMGVSPTGSFSLPEARSDTATTVPGSAASNRIPLSTPLSSRLWNTLKKSPLDAVEDELAARGLARSEPTSPRVETAEQKRASEAFISWANANLKVGERTSLWSILTSQQLDTNGVQSAVSSTSWYKKLSASQKATLWSRAASWLATSNNDVLRKRGEDIIQSIG